LTICPPRSLSKQCRHERARLRLNNNERERESEREREREREKERERRGREGAQFPSKEIRPTTTLLLFIGEMIKSST
jgi:hypothetical protein